MLLNDNQFRKVCGSENFVDMLTEVTIFEGQRFHDVLYSIIYSINSFLEYPKEIRNNINMILKYKFKDWLEFTILPAPNEHIIRFTDINYAYSFYIDIKSTFSIKLYFEDDEDYKKYINRISHNISEAMEEFKSVNELARLSFTDDLNRTSISYYLFKFPEIAFTHKFLNDDEFIFSYKGKVYNQDYKLIDDMEENDLRIKWFRNKNQGNWKKGWKILLSKEIDLSRLELL